MSFLLTNGVVKDEKEVNLSSFILDDFTIIKKTIWFGYGGIPLFFENLKLIEQELLTLKKNIPETLKNKRELFRLTKRMLNKNKYYRSGLILFRIFISDSQINTLLTSQAFDTFDFQINTQGLLINFAETKRDSPSNNSLLTEALWQQTKIEIENTTFKNSVIFNKDNHVCECINSSIFMAKNNTIFTPTLKTGCFNDIFRAIVISLFRKNQIEIIEKEISKREILQMDEIFLISEKRGIECVLGIENRRFIHHYSDILHEQINKYLKMKVELV